MPTHLPQYRTLLHREHFLALALDTATALAVALALALPAGPSDVAPVLRATPQLAHTWATGGGAWGALVAAVAAVSMVVVVVVVPQVPGGAVDDMVCGLL